MCAQVLLADHGFHRSVCSVAAARVYPCACTILSPEAKADKPTVCIHEHEHSFGSSDHTLHACTACLCCDVSSNLFIVGTCSSFANTCRRFLGMVSEREQFRCALLKRVQALKQHIRECDHIKQGIRGAVHETRTPSPKTEKALLLSLVAHFSAGDDFVVRLVALLCNAVCPWQAKSSAWVAKRWSALAFSRQQEFVAQARHLAEHDPSGLSVSRAQRLAVEARVAVWVRRMTRNGVVPMACHFIRHFHETAIAATAG